ncbi:MAG: hypothetical protein O7C56_02920 [Rickettsia endosymbiont of Ixodes persulcatus]|nr:hypothetical protein [Rickettsia endosymbiont of Ixodes persulcatus]
MLTPSLNHHLSIDGRDNVLYNLSSIIFCHNHPSLLLLLLLSSSFIILLHHHSSSSSFNKLID